MLGDSLPDPSPIVGFQPDVSIRSGAEAFMLGAKETLVDLPFEKTQRWAEFRIMGGQDKVDPKLLNERYGVPGEKLFDEPMTKRQALLKRQWYYQDKERKDKIERVSGFWANTQLYSGYFGGFVADPVMLGMTVAPLFTMGEMAGAATGTVAAKSLMRVAGEELLTNSAIETYSYALSQASDKRYDGVQALFNVAIPTGISTGLVGAGRGIKNAAAKRLAAAAAESRNITNKTREKMFNAVMDDILTDGDGALADLAYKTDDVRLRQAAGVEVEMEAIASVRDPGSAMLDTAARATDIDETFNLGLTDINGDVIPDQRMSGRAVYTSIDADAKNAGPLVFSESMDDVVNSSGTGDAVIRATELDMKNPTDIHGVRRIADDINKTAQPFRETQPTAEMRAKKSEQDAIELQRRIEELVESRRAESVSERARAKLEKPEIVESRKFADPNDAELLNHLVERGDLPPALVARIPAAERLRIANDERLLQELSAEWLEASRTGLSPEELARRIRDRAPKADVAEIQIDSRPAAETVSESVGEVTTQAQGGRKFQIDTSSLEGMLRYKTVVNKLRELGYDGVVMRDKKTGSIRYAVLDKSQMKIGATGELDRKIATVAEIRDRIQKRAAELREVILNEHTVEQRKKFEAYQAAAKKMREADPEVQGRKDPDIEQEVAKIEKEVSDVEELMGAKTPEEKAAMEVAENVKTDEEIALETMSEMADCILENVRNA
jgi:hypothetical protein